MNRSSAFHIVYCLHDWLAAPGVELAEDLAFAKFADEACVEVHRPLRLEVTEPAGTLALVLRPLRADRTTVRLWAAKSTDRLDYYEVINQRLQNYLPHLRRIPGTYDMDSWTDAELAAECPTTRCAFELEPTVWSHLAVTWGPDASAPGQARTRAFVNGVAVADAPGVLHRLLAMHADVRGMMNVEGNMYWHRMALLCGVAVARASRLSVGLDPDQARALSRAGCGTADEPAAASSPPTATALFDRAPGVRLHVSAAEPVPDAWILDVRRADRCRYWHHEARDTRDGVCLTCIPSGTPSTLR